MSENRFFGAQTDTHDFGRLVSNSLTVPFVFAFRRFFHRLAFLDPTITATGIHRRSNLLYCNHRATRGQGEAKPGVGWGQAV